MNARPAVTPAAPPSWMNELHAVLSSRAGWWTVGQLSARLPNLGAIRARANALARCGLARRGLAPNGAPLWRASCAGRSA
jgi:hypothetical protein